MTPCMSHKIDLDLSDFPLPRDEPFTAAQARAAGVSTHRLRRLCQDGLIRSPLRNAYVDSSLSDTLDLRTRILALVVPEGCFVCDRTAGWLHGANMILAPGDHLVVPPVSMFRHADAGRLRNALASSGERTLSSGDLVNIGGIWVTTPLRTALDLGRLLKRDQALAALDSLLRLGVYSLEELRAEVYRFVGQRGVRQLRALVPLADAGAQSPPEAALRLRWYDAGLPRPRLQIPVIVDGRVVYYLDMGLEELLFGAEYDGEEWHSEDQDTAYDDARRRWLGQQRNWQIEVFGRVNVYGRNQDATERLAAAFRRAKQTLGCRTIITGMTAIPPPRRP